MEYRLETVGTNPIKKTFGEPKVKVLFKIKNDLIYNSIVHNDIDIISIINQVKENHNDKTWEQFLEYFNKALEVYREDNTNLDSQNIDDTSYIEKCDNLIDISVFSSFQDNEICEPNLDDYEDEQYLEDEGYDEDLPWGDNNSEYRQFLNEFTDKFYTVVKDKEFQDAIHFRNQYATTVEVTETDYYKYAKLLEFKYYHELVNSNFKVTGINDFLNEFNDSYYQQLLQEINSHQYINISLANIEDIMIELDCDPRIIDTSKTQEEIAAHFLDKVKECTLPLLLKVYEKYIDKGFYYFSVNFPYDNTKIDDTYYHILNNIDSIINGIIQKEEEVIKNIQNNRLFLNFKEDYKALQPIIKCFWGNSNVMQNYFIDFHNIIEEHKSGRGNQKPFLPAGMCHYREKIYINSTNWHSYIRYGKNWAVLATRNIFLHELGHAIDHSYQHFADILPGKTLKGRFISNNDPFKKFNRMIYQGSRKYSSKQYDTIIYYVHPKINVIKNVVTYDWSRTNHELFAESFALISNWLINGFNKQDTFIIDMKLSKQRFKIKLFMPILKYLLKNINWNDLGIDSITLRKRKTLVKKFLAKVDSLPIPLKLSRRGNQSNKIHSFKKPTRNKLIRK